MRCESTMPMYNVQCAYLNSKNKYKNPTTFQSFGSGYTLYALQYADYKNALSFVVQRTIHAINDLKYSFFSFVCRRLYVLLLYCCCWCALFVQLCFTSYCCYNSIMLCYFGLRLNCFKCFSLVFLNFINSDAQFVIYVYYFIFYLPLIVLFVFGASIRIYISI